MCRTTEQDGKIFKMQQENLPEDFREVTSCSHIFCEEDGARHFKKSHTCPACETVLGGKFAILKVDLELSEHNKAMALAGQNPVTIMEICTKALSFWMYQNHQERLYNEYIAMRAKEKTTQMEQYYEQIISSTQAELKCSTSGSYFEEKKATCLKNSAEVVGGLKRHLKNYPGVVMVRWKKGSTMSNNCATFTKILFRLNSALIGVFLYYYSFNGRALKNKVKVQTNEQEETKASLKEVSERLLKKDLQFQKLETMYDQLRRIVISTRSCDDFGIYKEIRSPWTENYQLPVDQGEVVRVCDVPCPNISSRAPTPNIGRDALMRPFSIPAPCGDGGMQMRKAFDIPVGPN